MALIELAPGEVGAVVTYLEMVERPSTGPMPESPFLLERWLDPDPAAYRALFGRIGGRWLWFSRLLLDDNKLSAAIGEVHIVTDGSDRGLGMIELDFSTPSECLIRFLGLAPDLAGKGHGAWLFAKTLELAWRTDVRRVHLNTCTLDHPAALPSYSKAGFRAYKRAFESFPDPRLRGVLPSDIAPGVPIL